MKYDLAARFGEDEAARYLGKSPGTLRNWRMTGKGPRFHRSGRGIFYMADDLDDYITESSERAG
jgi:hypothetical protein